VNVIVSTGNAIQLTSTQLTRHVQSDTLSFTDTSELLSSPLAWIGQERAQTAARFGLEMAQPNYNLFVLGEEGSGRASLLQDMMAGIAARRPQPPDLCFLHHFEEPERPIAVHLPAGDGRKLRLSMAQLIKTLVTEIPKRLAGQDFKVEREHIEKCTSKKKTAPLHCLTNLPRPAISLCFMKKDGWCSPCAVTKGNR